MITYPHSKVINLLNVSDVNINFKSMKFKYVTNKLFV